MPPPSATRRKNTLFCPRCGHESPADGDWCRTPTPGETITCPVCAAIVASDPSTV
jgi:transcription elongation factor Elf1